MAVRSFSLNRQKEGERREEGAQFSTIIPLYVINFWKRGVFEEIPFMKNFGTTLERGRN